MKNKKQQTTRQKNIDKNYGMSHKERLAKSGSVSLANGNYTTKVERGYLVVTPLDKTKKCR